MKKNQQITFAIGLISSVYSLSARNISANYGDIIEKIFHCNQKIPIKMMPLRSKSNKYRPTKNTKQKPKLYRFCSGRSHVIRDVVVDTGRPLVPIVGKGLWIVTKEQTTKGIYELALEKLQAFNI